MQRDAESRTNAQLKNRLVDWNVGLVDSRTEPTMKFERCRLAAAGREWSLAACEGFDLYQGSAVFGNMGFDESHASRFRQFHTQSTTKWPFLQPLKYGASGR